MVVTTATMPMMMPSVVKAPRARFARSARKAICSDSRRSKASLTAVSRSARLGSGGLLGILIDRHHRPVSEVLGDRAVAAGDDFLAFAEARHDLDELVALDAGRDLPGDRL